MKVAAVNDCTSHATDRRPEFLRHIIKSQLVIYVALYLDCGTFLLRLNIGIASHLSEYRPTEKVYVRYSVGMSLANPYLDIDCKHATRGVQTGPVRECMMHKCFMVKVGWKGKTDKAWEKHVNSPKSKGTLPK